MFVKLISITGAVILCNLKAAQGVTCKYSMLGDSTSYSCDLTNQNIQSDLDMVTVDGEHLDGYADKNVTFFSVISSTVQVFPSLIIDKV